MVSNGGNYIRESINVKSGVAYNEDWVSTTGKHNKFSLGGSQFNHPSRMTKDELH